MAIIHFLSLFGSLHFWQYFFGKSAQIKYQINTKIHSCGKIISSCLEEDCKTMLHAFLLETLLLATPGCRICPSKGDWEGSPHYLKNALSHISPSLLCPKNVDFANFFCSFWIFYPIVPQQVDPIWETLRLRSDPN